MGKGELIMVTAPLLFTNYGMLNDGSRPVVAHLLDCVKDLRYYVFTGKNIPDLLRCYHRITGMPSMLPRWAFGYIKSKERYRTGA